MANLLSPAYRRVVIIAPEYTEEVYRITGVARLDTTPETDAISDQGYDVQTIDNVVSYTRLMERARSGTACDILQFTGHGDAKGAMLTNGEILTAPMILQLAQTWRAKVVFFNFCNSSVIGQYLVDNGVPCVIVTLTPVDDNIAKFASQTFYSILARTDDPYAAFKAAKGGGQVYSWMADGGYQKMILEPFMAELELLRDAIKCSGEWGTKGAKRLFAILLTLQLVVIVMFILTHQVWGW
jgi:hypothetical protein